MIGSGDEWLAAGILREINFYQILVASIAGGCSTPQSEELSGYNEKTVAHILNHIKMTMQMYFNTWYCTCDSFHLWHGDFSNRQYTSRYDIVNECKIDIEEDIFINDNGLLEFKEHKLDASARLYKFFLDRKEDS